MKKVVKELKLKASEVRRDTFQSIIKAQSGHVGGSMSIVEILTVLYFKFLRLNNFEESRDCFLLSKGHAVPTLYTMLAHKGIIEKELLNTLRNIDSPLQGHPDKNKVKGLEISAGSLGQGLSAAIGFAMAQKLKKIDRKTYVLLGDGEVNEGQVWEAAMAGAHFKLDNLVVIIDRNGLQLDGTTHEIMSLGDLRAKWKAFGWHVVEVDGHNIEELLNVFEMLEHFKKAQPTVIIAHTVKGKGVSTVEGKVESHGGIPNPEQTKQIMAELEKEVLKWQK